MLGSKLNKSNIKDIKEILSFQVEKEENRVDIYIKTWSNFNTYEYYLVARLFIEECQGCYTYIKGIEKEYKTVKPVINALLKEYSLMLEGDLIIDYIKTNRKNNNEVAEIVEVAPVNVETEVIESTPVTKENKINNNKFYIGKMEFVDYASAEQYCIKNDFLPELMITTIDYNKSIVGSKEIEKEININTSNINNNSIELYKDDTITIIGIKEIYTSCVTNESHDTITSMEIIKDNELFYNINGIDFPINTNGKYIDIMNYIDNIVLYCKYSKVEKYWQEIALNELLKDKRQFGRIFFAVKEIKQELKDIEDKKESELREKQRQGLLQEIKQIANDKNYIIVNDLFNIIIMKNDSKRDMITSQNNKNFIDMIINKVSENSELIKPYEPKLFKLEYNSNDIEILQDAKQFVINL